MKTKILLASLMLFMLCMTGCKKDEPEQEQNKKETNVLDPAYCTNVKVEESYHTSIDDLNIRTYDANGYKVGTGTNLGSYLVPYDGYMLIDYTCGKKTYKDNRINVGSAHELRVVLYSDGEVEVAN